MFQGSIVALVTPMHADGSLDEESLNKLVEFHIEQGSDALVAMGTTGESATLNEKEHCHFIRQVVRKFNNRSDRLDTLRRAGRGRRLFISNALL